MAPTGQSIANDVPNEIWDLIASHIAAGSPSRAFPAALIGVNRHFFSFYLSEKYGDVQWTKLDEATVRQLQRLQSPVIASHVRKLLIHAWFIDYLLVRDVAERAARKQRSLRTLFPKAQTGSVEERLKSVENRIAGSFQVNSPRKGQYSSALKEAPDTSCAQPVLDAMVEAIRLMFNVLTYTLELRDLSLTQGAELFLISGGQTFGNNLAKLVLYATLSNFGSAVESTQFPRLEELYLHFDYASGEVDCGHITNAVVPFINSRRDVLRTLDIASSSSLDLTPLFRSIGPFPALRNLSLDICFDESHLSDSRPLIDLFRGSRTALINLAIKVRVETHPKSLKAAALAARTKSWDWLLVQILKDKDLLTNCVERSVGTLTSLAIMDAKLNFTDLERVLNVLAPCAYDMRHLHIEVEQLTTQCLKTIAARLPHLFSLAIVFDAHHERTFEAEMLHLVDTPDVRLSTWNLQDSDFTTRV